VKNNKEVDLNQLQSTNLSHKDHSTLNLNNTEINVKLTSNLLDRCSLIDNNSSNNLNQSSWREKRWGNLSSNKSVRSKKMMGNSQELLSNLLQNKVCAPSMTNFPNCILRNSWRLTLMNIWNKTKVAAYHVVNVWKLRKRTCFINTLVRWRLIMRQSIANLIQMQSRVVLTLIKRS